MQSGSPLSLSPSACLCHVFVFVGRGFGCRERTWTTWRLFCIEFIVIASPKKLSMVVLSQERLQLLPSVCAAWFYCPGQAFGDSWRASPSGCRCPWTWNVCHRRCCPELRSAVKFCAGWHTLDDVGIDYSRLRIVSFTARFIQVMNHMVTSIPKTTGMQCTQLCHTLGTTWHNMTHLDRTWHHFTHLNVNIYMSTFSKKPVLTRRRSSIPPFGVGVMPCGKSLAIHRRDSCWTVMRAKKDARKIQIASTSCGKTILAH